MEKPSHSAEFGLLYTQQFRGVWRMLQRLGVHPGFVDDATQEVFITAWRRWTDFEGRSSHRTWLLGIAIRVASDTRRKQRPSEEISPEVPTTAPGPEALVASRAAARRVAQMLAQLDPAQRELLLLVDVEGYSVPEVAEATSVNLNTLYTRLRAARQKFEELAVQASGEL